MTVHYAKKMQEKKYIETKDVAAEAVKNDHKNDSPIERVKTFAMKKAIRFLAWVAVLQNEIQSVTMVLGVVGGVMSIVNAVKEYSFGKKLHRTLSKIEMELYSFHDAFKESWNNKCNNDLERYENLLNAVNELKQS